MFCAFLFTNSALFGKTVMYVPACVVAGGTNMPRFSFGFAARRRPAPVSLNHIITICPVAISPTIVGIESAATLGLKQAASFMSTICWSDLRQPGVDWNVTLFRARLEFQFGSFP